MSAYERLHHEEEHLHDVDAALERADATIREAVDRSKRPSEGHLLPTEEELPRPIEELNV